MPERYRIAALGLNDMKARRRKLEAQKQYLDRVFKDWKSQHPSFQNRTH